MSRADVLGEKDIVNKLTVHAVESDSYRRKEGPAVENCSGKALEQLACS